jgi:hypothetical protein
MSLRNAKLDDGNLTFEIVTGNALFKVSLKAEGDAMKGGVTGPGDGTAAAPYTMDVKREK